MVGLRYLNFNDRFLNSTYLGPTPALPDGPVAPITGTVTEQINELTFDTDNHAFGGQLGFRYFKYRDRWRFSTDFRLMALENFWKQVQRNYTVVTEYGGIGTTPFDYEYVASDQRAYYHDNDFVIGFDVRAEAAYQITKSFSLRGGIQVLDLETGIIRGNAVVGQGINGPVLAAGQDVQMYGVTFGFEINR